MGVLRREVEGEPRCAENRPSTKTPSVNVTMGDARWAWTHAGGRPNHWMSIRYAGRGVNKREMTEAWSAITMACVSGKRIPPCSHGRELMARLGYIFAATLPGPALSPHATKVASRSAVRRRNHCGAGTKAAW